MRPKSIQLRLQLWFGILLALLVAGFGATAFQLQKIAVLEKIDADLEQRVETVNVAFRNTEASMHARPRKPGQPPMDFREARPHGTPPLMLRPPDRPRRTAGQLPKKVTQLFAASNQCLFAVWDDAGILLAQSSPEAAALPRPADPYGRTAIRHRTRGHWRDAYQFTEMRDCILVSCDIAAEQARLLRYAGGLATIGALVLAFGLGGGFLFSRLLARSIRNIGDTAKRISEERLSERIPTAGMDRELGQLAEVLNATFARLDAAFARQRQFTADAAHELRTPLAVILSDAQSALRRERSAEEYRDTIRSCEESAQKMRRLSESLLELARLDAGAELGPRSPADLAQLAQEAFGLVRAQAALHDIQIQLELSPAAVTCHPEQILRVFCNLLVNAIDYNHPGGSVRIATRPEPAGAVAIIADTGEGIAPEAMPHIFDRFYRANQARPRADGHCGLGLAICKSILDAHGARIEVACLPGQGTTFTLRFPPENHLS